MPDTIKVLFRPVSMMIPDYALIAEMMLYAEGFENAQLLSKKMVKMYKLASEQLSQQDHYDFGMRAVKSVLVMAGSLKRAEPGLTEDITLIRALRDSNVRFCVCFCLFLFARFFCRIDSAGDLVTGVFALSFHSHQLGFLKVCAVHFFPIFAFCRSPNSWPTICRSSRPSFPTWFRAFKSHRSTMASCSSPSRRRVRR